MNEPRKWRKFFAKKNSQISSMLMNIYTFHVIHRKIPIKRMKPESCSKDAKMNEVVFHYEFMCTFFFFCLMFIIEYSFCVCVCVCFYT